MFEKATIRPLGNLKNTEVEPVRLAPYYLHIIILFTLGRDPFNFPTFLLQTAS